MAFPTSSSPVSSGGAAAALGAMEENAMAILDGSGFRDDRDLLDDRKAFLEAVRSACLVADPAPRASWKMYNAVFQLLATSGSLELLVCSFELLIALEKRNPSVYLMHFENARDLVVAQEAWSPFILSAVMADYCDEKGVCSVDHLFDPSKFCRLIENMAQERKNAEFVPGIKVVRNSLLFIYLFTVMEADFTPRYKLYTESTNWSLLRESTVSMLMCSRKHVFKSIVRDCLTLLCIQGRHDVHVELHDMKSMKQSCAGSSLCTDISLKIAASELDSRMFRSIEKLLIMIMELDVARKEAEAVGITSRADGLRSYVLEAVLDELTYNKKHVPSFLMAFTDPKWKLEIILQYFSKYSLKPAVRTRKSHDSADHWTLRTVLTCFQATTSAKVIVKKMTSEFAMLLLAHAYHVCLSIDRSQRQTQELAKKIGGTLLQISTCFQFAIQNIRKIDAGREMSLFEKEALFVAATIAKRLSQDCQRE